MTEEERIEAARDYGERHDLTHTYIDRLVGAFRNRQETELSWVATMEPYHGVLMLGILRGDVVYDQSPF